jgi:hypothetical protein
LVIDFPAMKIFAFVILAGLLFQSIASQAQSAAAMARGALMTMSSEEFAKLEEARKQAIELARKAMEAARARMGRPRVRMANGGDPTKVIWPTVEESMWPKRRTLECHQRIWRN